MATHDEPTTSSEGDTPTLDVPGTEASTGAEPKAAPRRRRATKKAAAPAVTETASEPESTTEESAAAEPAPAPKKRAPRKTAKKAAKATLTDEAPAEVAAATPDEQAPADDKAEKPKKATTSRAKRATSAESETVEQAEAPKKRSRSRKAATVEPEPLPEPEVVEDAEDEDESAEGETEILPEEVPAAPAAMSSFGLLFQAPDVTAAPRRRRATSPAQAPAERPAEPTEPTEPVAQDEPAEASEDESRDARDESAEESAEGGRRRRRGGRGRRGRGGSDRSEQGDAKAESKGDAKADAKAGKADTKDKGAADAAEASDDSDSGPADDSGDTEQGESGSSRRRRRRRRSGLSGDSDDPPGTVTKVREPRKDRDEPTAVKGSTRLEAKKQRRREGREAGRRRTIITEAEFLARRESVERVMAVRGKGDKTQIGVLEDGVLVEHYVSRESNASMAGNVYLGRVQNVLPSMEAAFVDIGKGRNAVLYAGEVNWDAAGLEQNQAKRIENALGSGDTVLVQVTKDPIGHKGARLTSQISLPGRYLVYVPEGSMTGISRKLPDTERARLKAILKEVVPDSAGVIVRTAAEGASEEELRADVERLTKAWDNIQKKAKAAASKKASNGGAPVLLHGEADLTVRVIRDVFTEDFSELIVSGDQAWSEVSDYVEDVAPDLAKRLTHWTSENDLFAHYRVDEQIAKAMDRKVWLPSGGSLVIDRTEAMTVVDVNTGKFVGSGGNLEETVTKNNIEAAEEIVRQLRLRDIGGIIVIDFIDMVLESNRDLVVRRLLECLGRDRTKHQVAEVTSLGLVQMTRKRVGSGLIEVFSEPCEHCAGRGIIVQSEPIDRSSSGGEQGHAHANGGGSSDKGSGRGRGRRGGKGSETGQAQNEPAPEPAPTHSGPTAAQIAAAAHAAAIKSMSGEHHDDDVAELTGPAQDDATVTASAPAESEPTSPTEDAPEAAAPGETTAVESSPAEPATVIAEVGTRDEEPEPVQAVARPAQLDEPVVRPRRKRGRVVAPAGPPRAADGPSTTTESAPADLEQVEGDR
ncbi:Rne/Rng family ribonuclease [Knoellia sp. CPCC 206450]|uniref:Rne/Rng family ribonuclease n=1 Tax=Knoellia tibetensis TaxID=3404798 RepID=UPI003B42E9AE